MDSNQIPQAFICPITGTIMVDPVMGTDGNSYEREAIVEWLSKKEVSPLTNELMMISTLKTNRALRDAIDDFKKGVKQWVNQDVQMVENDIPPLKEEPKREGILDLSIVRNDNNDVLISVKSPNINDRVPCDVVCVVDISGSMGTEVSMMNDQGQTEEHGLSIMDIVKHCVTTIVETLKPTDRFGLVVYNSKAENIFELNNVTNTNKTNIKRRLSKVTPNYTTNLWNGLLKGMEMLKRHNTTNRNSAIMLFTDGLPNERPARGEYVMLRKFVEETKFSSSIHTFGFGYSLESQLLQELALNGTYNYIPDSSLLGSILINALSSILVTAGTNVLLELENRNGSNLVDVYGDYPHEETDDDVAIDLGFIQSGQDKDIVVKITPTDDDVYLDATLVYQHNGNLSRCRSHMNMVENNPVIEMHKLRLHFVSEVMKAMNTMDINDDSNAREIIKELIKVFQQSSLLNQTPIKDLMKDLVGQVSIAFSRRDYYTRWGRHYLLSLVKAHQNQVCNNFKDSGVQHYGGQLFNKIRDEADTIFNSLPPPKPSVAEQARKYGSTKAYTACHSMSSYNCSSNPCFHGNCVVKMRGGKTKFVKDIRRGDFVKTPRGVTSVACVVKTYCGNSKADLVKLNGGLALTSWHPVRINGTWKFPCTINEPQNTNCDAVYSFVLDMDHVMIINDVECVTLGHNFKGEVVYHPYFGSQQIVDDLMKMSGWEDGLIELRTGCMVRNEDGLVCGIIENMD